VLASAFLDRDGRIPTYCGRKSDKRFQLAQLPVAEIECLQSKLFVLECVDRWTWSGLGPKRSFDLEWSGRSFCRADWRRDRVVLPLALPRRGRSQIFDGQRRQRNL